MGIWTIKPSSNGWIQNDQTWMNWIQLEDQISENYVGFGQLNL